MQQAGYIPQYHAESTRARSTALPDRPAKRDGQQGWRLHSIFEQDKNTIIVFERMIPHPQWGATQ
jgi:hypothetical protein